VVSIHAIATFQALHDYLRPRVAGLLGGGSRLSGMLAALAASGFTPGSASRTPGEEAPPQPPVAPPAAAAESSSAGAAASGSTITRRRSQRLSAKNAPAAEGTASDAPVAGSSSDGAVGSSVEGGPPSNIIDSEMAAEFTDEEEVDAEVFDDDVDPDNSISDKTVTLSIAEGT
jgi:E3 ubiquitin-protein ligase TRIP12